MSSKCIDIYRPQINKKNIEMEILGRNIYLDADTISFVYIHLTVSYIYR